MKTKIWNMSTISTEEQNIEIYPNEMNDGIIVEIKEANCKKTDARLYLNKEQMELFINRMNEMMDYVLK